MDKKYFSEENFEKIRKKMKITAIISIIIGICLIIYGIVFNSEFGFLFIIGGVLVILVLGTLGADPRPFEAYIAQNSMPIKKEVTKQMASSFREGFNKKYIYCKHCGNAIDADSIFCKICGKDQ